MDAHTANDRWPETSDAGPASRRHRTTPPVSIRSTRPRLLVVEDEPAVARFVERLMKKDCDLTIAENGAVALARIQSGAQFDVILCDMVMPVMNGMALYRALVERHPTLVTRVHFITGGVFTEAGASFLASLPNRVLDKPMNRSDLHAFIQGALEARLAA